MAWQTANEKPTIDNLILAWREAKNACEAAVKRERDLRAALVEAAFPAATEGTNTLELGQGWQLKAVIKYHYNLDRKQIDVALDEITNTGEDGAFIAERIVKWKPELSIREYRALDAQHRRIIDRVLTKTEAAPTVELVEPKA